MIPQSTIQHGFNITINNGAACHSWKIYTDADYCGPKLSNISRRNTFWKEDAMMVIPPRTHLTLITMPYTASNFDIALFTILIPLIIFIAESFWVVVGVVEHFHLLPLIPRHQLLFTLKRILLFPTLHVRAAFIFLFDFFVLAKLLFFVSNFPIHCHGCCILLFIFFNIVWMGLFLFNILEFVIPLIDGLGYARLA